MNGEYNYSKMTLSLAYQTERFVQDDNEVVFSNKVVRSFTLDAICRWQHQVHFRRLLSNSFAITVLVVHRLFNKA